MGIKANYTASSLIEDCNSINSFIYGVTFEGPGITATADSTWYKKIGDISWYCGTFSVRAAVFSDPSQLTISNLLSDQYTS